MRQVNSANGFSIILGSKIVVRFCLYFLISAYTVVSLKLAKRSLEWWYLAETLESAAEFSDCAVKRFYFAEVLGVNCRRMRTVGGVELCRHPCSR